MKDALSKVSADVVGLSKSSSGAPGSKRPAGDNLDDILTQAKSRIEAVKVPNEFFSGHSDIVEFLELTIKARKTGQAPPDKDAATQSRPPIDFALAGAARQSLDRARRELPFLDYELSESFKNIIQSGFVSGQVPPMGAPPAGRAPGSFGRPSGLQPPYNQAPKGSAPPTEPMRPRTSPSPTP